MRFAVASAALAVCTAMFVLTLLGSSQGALPLDASAAQVTAVTFAAAGVSEPVLKVDPAVAAAAIGSLWLLGSLLAGPGKGRQPSRAPAVSPCRT